MLKYFFAMSKCGEMNNSVTFILFGFMLTVWTCSDETTENLFKDPEKIDSVVTYTIPAGLHSSAASAYQFLTASSIRFTARFDSSAIYQTVDSRNQGDINKLYGMADCNSVHQVNSARFGWRWFGNVLQIWAYNYVNGERQIAFIKNVPLNSTNTYELAFADSAYIFKVDELQITLPRHCAEEAKGYKLYPYFGGDESAPHEITIIIQDL
jgi:hypothetical protein